MLKTFSIRSLGCKVNQYESQQVRELLQGWGLQTATRTLDPDLIVLHTCCVTATASAKSRQTFRRLLKQHPHATVVVCGCLPGIEPPTSSDLAKNILYVRDRESLATELGQLMEKKTSTRLEEGALKHPHITIKTDSGSQINIKPSLKQLKLPNLSRFNGQTRAFLKIQDGCDAHCAYCIIPKVRAELSSKPADQALAEARSMVHSGHREIVLTGVSLGAYNYNTARNHPSKAQAACPLSQLLGKMAQIEGLPRIRLSSLAPPDITPALIQTMARYENIMPHLHLSLQSGSDTVLKRMGRHYTAAEFRETVGRIRALLPDPALTTDIIVGFPGETDAEFRETLSLARDIGFAKIHVFAFSPRAGTAAAVMKNKVHNQTIQARSRELRSLDHRLGQNYRQRFLGQRCRVLIETQKPVPAGLSERYFKVYLPDTHPKPRKNDLVTVALTQPMQDGLMGLPVTEPSYI
jgi:threonylcarbamoyladenosine tRNA methylthiotransferase MtaB